MKKATEHRDSFVTVAFPERWCAAAIDGTTFRRCTSEISMIVDGPLRPP